MRVYSPADLVAAADVRRAVTSSAYRKGEVYWRQDRVVELEVSADGMMIDSAVKGSERRPYRQQIVLQSRSGGFVIIEGDCTCPMEDNCKHVAAAVLAHIADRKSLRGNERNARVVAFRPDTPPDGEDEEKETRPSRFRRT